MLQTSSRHCAEAGVSYRVSAAVATSLLTILTACGGGTAASSCAAIERVIEPGSIHVLPGNVVRYMYSPPTSGPHQVPAPDPGIFSEAITEPRQVAALESGFVLLQYDRSASAADVAALEALASIQGVMVAPGVRTFDQDASIAFTAWTKQQLCIGLDVEAAEAFIEEHVGLFFRTHE